MEMGSWFQRLQSKSVDSVVSRPEMRQSIVEEGRGETAARLTATGEEREGEERPGQVHSRGYTPRTFS